MNQQIHNDTSLSPPLTPIVITLLFLSAPHPIPHHST